MQSIKTIGCLAALAIGAATLGGCRNDGAGPIAGESRSADSAVPGSGGGNSATGASGGSATSPGQNAGAVPGSSGGAMATGGNGSGQATASGHPDMAGTPQPTMDRTTPSR